MKKLTPCTELVAIKSTTTACIILLLLQSLSLILLALLPSIALD